MKCKKLLIAILVLLLASTCFAPYPITHRNVSNPNLLTRLLQDRIGTLDDQVSDLEALSGGVFDNIGTGSIFYCDSGAAADGAGTTWATAVDTLQEAVDLCTDNAGDVIYVAQNHGETVASAAALNFDKAGITVVGIGNGEDQPTISMITAASATVQISAADVMLYNLRFLGAYTNGITECLDITANGDGAIIAGCQFRETTNDMELLIMITVTAAADELVIVGNRFIGIDGGNDSVAIALEGASNQSVIANNYFFGEWSDYVIANGATSISMLIENNVICNVNTTGKLMSFSAASTGSLINNKCYGNGTSFALVAAAMFVGPDNVFMQTKNVATRNFETMFGPYRGDAAGTAGDSVFADFVLIDALLDLILADFTDYQLDHVAGASTTVDADADLTTYIADKSSLSHVMTTGADTSDYRASTMSLQALGADTDTIITAVGTTLPATLTGINNTIASITASSNGYAGTCEVNAGGTTFAVCASLAGFGDDYFNTGWSLMVVLNFDTAGGTPEGEIIDIIDYDTGTGTFELNVAAGAAITTGDGIWIMRKEELNLDDKTILGCAGTIRYVDSGTSGDGSGLTLENAYATFALAEAGCSAGDVVYIADGHDEEIGDIVIDVANVSFIGMGEGDAKPLLTCDAGTDEITLDAAGITVKNVRLQAGADQVVTAFRVEDAGIGCTLENISFIKGEGANEEFVICIDVDAAAAQLTIKDCTYYNSNATTAHASCFIDLTDGTIDQTTITGCTAFGEFANGCIYSDQVLTNLSIIDNVISNTTSTKYAIQLSAAATGVLTNNRLYSDSYLTMLDPGSLKCSGNLGVDAIDQQAIAIPISAETSDVTEVAAGSNLERLEWLQKQTDDIASVLGIDSTADNVFYVDASVAGGSGLGTSWIDAEATLVLAIGDATTNTGAYIFVASNHAENIVGSVAVNKAGISIIGLGVGEARPIFTFDTANDSLAHTVPDVKYKNLIFTPSTQDNTVGISLDASSDGAIFEDCEWRNATTNEFVDMVTLASGTDNVRFTRCRFINNTAAGSNVSAITNTSGTCTGMVIEDCYFYGAFTTAAIEGDQADTNVRIINNTIHNSSTGDYAVKWASNTSFGEFTNNRLYADTVATILDPGGLKCFGNLATDAIDEGGIPIPTSQDTTVVTLDADGSVLERLEFIQQQYSVSKSITTLVDVDVAMNGLFTIAGGPILVTNIVTYIDTNIATEGCLIGYNMNPTTPAADTEFGQTSPALECNGMAAGTVLVWDGVIANDLTATTNGVALHAAVGVGLILPPGSVELDVDHDGTCAGAVTVYMSYEPMAPGVTVVAQ